MFIHFSNKMTILYYFIDVYDVRIDHINKTDLVMYGVEMCKVTFNHNVAAFTTLS